MPPSAAPEWLRVGWSFETTATSAPASNASIAARMPAQPAPITRTSCAASTRRDASGTHPPPARRVAGQQRPGRGDLGVDVRELLEVLAEHRASSPALASYALGIAPGRARVEQRRCRPRAPRPAPRSRTPRRRGTRPRRARPRAPRAGARASPAIGIRWPLARPGRPVQPVLTSQTVGSCSASFSPSRRGVDRRRLRQERAAEAGRERRRRLGDADLGAGEPRREAGEEVVARLGGRQPRDRRHDPERVGGQEDDVRRDARPASPAARSRSARAVGGARVLGLRVAVEVEPPALVDDDVLEQRPEGPRRRVDLGLGLGARGGSPSRSSRPRS